MCKELPETELKIQGANWIPRMLIVWVCQDLDIPLWSKGKASTSTVLGTKPIELTWTLPRSHKLDGVFAYEQREILC